eukprot:scaffold19502_cov264-Skeletonema_marinoi.AAC.1
MAKNIGSIEAVDYHIHSVRYDMAVNRGACGRLCEIRYGRQQRSLRSSRLRWPYQVTYDILATPIRPTNA